MRRAAGLSLLLAASAARADVDAPARGWTWEALPTPSYTTDEGYGLGVRVKLVDHAAGDVHPFRYALVLSLFETSREIFDHSVSFDAPHFLGSRERFGMSLAWSRYAFFPYYGVGNTSEYHPEYDTCADRGALATDPDICPGNPAFRGLRYYAYGQDVLPRVTFGLRHDLGTGFQLLAGYRFELVRLHALYGADDLGQRSTSKLIEDARAGLLDGWDGTDPQSDFLRRDATLTGGVAYDSRDDENQPSRGTFDDASLRVRLAALGGEFDGWGANLTLRGYLTLVPGRHRLVAAARVLADAAGGDVPFFELGATGGLASVGAVGGDSSVRGLIAYRLQGQVKVVSNLELRWRAFAAGPIAVGLNAGLDAGRAWRTVGLSDGGSILFGGALGLRVIWNREFVIRVDYGLGLSEPYGDGSLYLTFDELF